MAEEDGCDVATEGSRTLPHHPLLFCFFSIFFLRKMLRNPLFSVGCEELERREKGGGGTALRAL